MKQEIDRAVKKHFKPEFINRLDDVVIFKALDKEHLTNVIELELNKLRLRLERKEIHLELDQAAKDLLVNQGFQPEMGARTMRRIIEQKVEDPLAEKILLDGEEPKTYHVTVESDELVFTETKKEAKELEQAAKSP